MSDNYYNNIIAQSQDTSNNNVKDIIEGGYTEEDEQEDNLTTNENQLGLALEEFTEEIINGDIPYFDSLYPYDLLKIIFATILGEPRLSFSPIENNSNFKVNNVVEAYKIENKKRKVLFRVKTDFFNFVDKDILNFSETLFTEEKNYNSITDFSKLFYNYGRIALGFIAATLIKIDANNKNEPLSPQYEGVYSNLYTAIMNNKSKLIEVLDFVNKEGYIKENENNIILSLDNLYNTTMNLHQQMEKNPNVYIDIGQILSSTFVSLSLLLLGITLKTALDINITAENLFDKDTAENVADRFVNGVIASEMFDLSTKNRIISLFYIHNKITNFYNTYLGYPEFETLMIPIIAIGNIISGFDEEYIAENINITAYTQSDLGYTEMNLESFLSCHSFLTTPNMFIKDTMKCDMGDKIGIATGLCTFMSTLSTPKYKLDAIDSIIRENTDPKSYKNESTVIGFYNSFIMSFVENIPMVISPRTYFILSLYAATFAKIEKENSGDLKKFGALGRYQAEGYMYYLFIEWFKTERAYNIDESINMKDQTYIVKKIKGRALICNIAARYLDHFTETEPTPKDWVDRYKLSEIYTSDSQYISIIGHMPKSISNEDDQESELTKVATGEYPIINLLSKYNEITHMIKSEFEITYRDNFLEYFNDLVIEENPDTFIPMIVDNKVSKVVSTAIEKIMNIKSTDDDFTIKFALFIKINLMIAMVKDSYENLISRDNTKLMDFSDAEEDEYSYRKMIPYVSSSSTFNFLNTK